MDILTHSLSGIAVGTAIISFSKKNLIKKGIVLFFSGLGGAFPDIDAVSLWKSFDSSAGKLLGLSHSGEEIYFSKFWYSHHAFFHSILAALLFALIIGLLFYCIRIKINKSFIESLRKDQLLLLGFILGCFAHQLGDTVTPGCVWGGVDMFWPLGNYIGGTGKIWWWNNYDIFLIVFICILINLIVVFSVKKIRINTKIITLLILIFAFIVIKIQIESRNFNFNYTNHTMKYYEYELKSKEIQKEILGDRIYGLMNRLDNKLKIHF